MGARLGRYELLERLGRGGMGEVFLARAEGAPPVVLKRLLPHLTAERAVREAFLREAGVAARLAHPNIARVLELGEADGAFFFTMELVEGKDVRSLGGLALPLAVRIIADGAAALDAAHHATDASGRALGIVHGDVTPTNLLVAGDGVTKLIDFGLAKVRATRDDDSLGGTFEYLAPEQALEGVTTERTDQFSLGVVAWELLTGRRLFAGDTDTLTLDQVLACRVTRAQLVNPSVPSAVDQVVMRMLARDPAERFSRCGEIAEALERWLVETRATGVRGELGRLVRGRRKRTAAPPAHVANASEPAPMAKSPLTPFEAEALRQLAALPAPISLETIEQALQLGPGAPPVLDVAQALVERGLLRRSDDGAFTVERT